MLKHQGIVRLFCLCCFFSIGFLSSAWAQAEAILIDEKKGSILRGLWIDPDYSDRFHFFFDPQSDQPIDKSIHEADDHWAMQDFFHALTIPSQDLWVNLSYQEPQRILPSALDQTHIGAVLLEQDLKLKQTFSQLLHPQNPIGQQLWRQRMAMPVWLDDQSLTQKVWIYPERVDLVSRPFGAWVNKTKLGVQLEDDYLGTYKEVLGTESNRQRWHELLRAHVVLELKTLVNESAEFLDVRRTLNAVVLASWYRQRMLHHPVYAYKVNDQTVRQWEKYRGHKERVFAQYHDQLIHGAFQHIFEHYQPATQQYRAVRLISGGIHSQGIDGVVTDLSTSPVPATIYERPDLSSWKPDKEEDKRVVHLILKLINDLANKQIIPKVVQTPLTNFAHQLKTKPLIEWIQKNSVIKSLPDIRRILLWKLQIEDKNGGSALSSLSSKDVQNLYQAIFDVETLSKQLKPDSNAKLKIVIFRREKSSQSITDILRINPGMEVHVVTGAPDDGGTWYQVARQMDMPGIPSAAKALLDLSNATETSAFLAYRLDDKAFEHSNNVFQFFENIKKLQAREIYEIVGTLIQLEAQGSYSSQDIRKEIATDLIYAHSMIKKNNRDNDSPISFSGMPLRNLALMGAAGRYRDGVNVLNKEENYWQAAVDRYADFLGVTAQGHHVWFTTQERQHLFGIRADGTVYSSQEAMDFYKTASPYIGLWLLKDPPSHQFVKELKQRLKDQDIDLNVIDETISAKVINKIKLAIEKDSSGKWRHLGEANILDQIKQDLFSVPTAQASQVANMIDTLYNDSHDLNALGSEFSLQDPLKDVILQSDIIIYSGESIETNLGAALLVPGMGDALSESKALKILLSPLSNQDYNRALSHLERIYHYANRQIRLDFSNTVSWETSELPVDYVIRKLPEMMKEEDGASEDLIKQYGQYIEDQMPNHTVGVVDLKPDQNNATATLFNALLSLWRLDDLGYRVSAGRLLQKRHDIPRERRGWGLIPNSETINQLLNMLVTRWDDFIKKGVFVFDVDMTLLPKKGKPVLQKFKELSTILVRLLIEGAQVRIISGNSETQQRKRIFDSLSEIAGDIEGALEGFGMYVNGGATLVEMKNDVLTKETKTAEFYNQMFGMSSTVLIKAIDLAIKSLSQYQQGDKKYWQPFGLTEVQQKQWQTLIEDYMTSKYPNLKLELFWHEGLEIDIRHDGHSNREDKITIPWIEPRGGVKDSDRVASVSVSPMPNLPIDQNEIENQRQRLADLIKQFDLKAEYFLQSSNTTTEELIDQLFIEDKGVYYLRMRRLFQAMIRKYLDFRVIYEDDVPPKTFAAIKNALNSESDQPNILRFPDDEEATTKIIDDIIENFSDSEKFLRDWLTKKEYDRYHLRDGGSTTTDITKKGADKVTAMIDIVLKANGKTFADIEGMDEGGITLYMKDLDKQLIIYFGDEFYEGGNDEFLAKVEELYGITFIAVNSKMLNSITEKAQFIGSTSQATMEFLEKVVHQVIARLKNKKTTAETVGGISLREYDALTDDGQATSVTEWLPLGWLERMPQS